MNVNFFLIISHLLAMNVIDQLLIYDNKKIHCLGYLPVREDDVQFRK